MYNFDNANSISPNVRTVQRHLKTISHGVEPDHLRIADFLNFLRNNNLPKVFVLSEDATRISGGFGYDASRDQVFGLVPPMDQHGMPMKMFFPASTPNKVLEYIRDYPVGRNLYVTMAQPLKSGAASFCLMYTCSDNKFRTDDVLRRWAHIDEQCAENDLDLVCRAADGDPRIVPAMLIEMGMPCSDENPFGSWYVAKFAVRKICMQDPTHDLNKLRMRLMKVEKRLILGKSTKISVNTLRKRSFITQRC